MEDTKLPEQGRDKKEILNQMQEFRTQDTDWKSGKAFSLVYYVDDDHYKFLKEAHNTFFSENGLNPMAFKSLKEMERQTVRMTVNMFQGNEDCVGVLTSGGTESILMAVKTYRDRARKLKPWILRPEIVVPESIHVAFNKACKYFDVKCKSVPVGDDFKVDVKKLKKAITRNTIMIGASAPQYPQGVIDDIPAIAAIAKKKGIPLHVDSCIGGYLLPWIKKIGYPVTDFDFSVDGVTSISTDIHKYGFGAKGASCLVYSSMDYMKYQFFVHTEWSGGVYASPSMPGTRPGGPIAAAWAAMMALGESGYLNEAKKIMETRDKFINGLNATPGVEVLGVPESSIVAWKTSDSAVSVFAVADQLEAKGWNVDRQQRPESIHQTISPHHAPIIDHYLADIAEAVAYVTEHPELAASGNAAMYGMVAKIPFRSMIQKSVLGIMEKMYSASGEMPDGESKDPENLSETIEQLGVQALEVKRKMNVVFNNILKKK
jgi:sphinganine-1-phosphate aldolase